MNWIIGIVSWLLKLVLKGPSQEATEAAKAASTQTQLQIEVKTNENVQKSAAAVVSVAKSIDTNDQLQLFESKDPNNRDNS